MRFLYTLLLYLIAPLILLRLLLRSRKAPAYRQRIAERFGFFSAPIAPGGIWVHAVSVGETIAATPMIRQLLARHPEPMTITTMTPTGSERVRALFAKEIAEGRVFHFYAPYDLPDAIARFIKRVRPRLLIVVETELWPNMIHGCANRGIPVLLANARLSARSARGYGRVAAIATPMLQAIVRVVAQNVEDGERFVALGLSPQKLAISGSVKFDLTLDEHLHQRAQELHSSFGLRPVWIAASTHEGEDDILIAAHQSILAVHADALLILVPRHPERFDAVADGVQRAGLSMQRRSAQDAVAPQTQVLLGDTMGELLLLFGAADVAFVGGSLIERGGHNMLEPAAWGIPIITGDSDFNFREISALLQAAGALEKCRDAAGIAALVSQWLGDAVECEVRGQAGLQVIDNNRGALARLIHEIEIVLR